MDEKGKRWDRDGTEMKTSEATLRQSKMNNFCESEDLDLPCTGGRREKTRNIVRKRGKS